ncbi:hypothetical protein WJX73_006709 [Symbiochloris irregularis]|uniref:Uncharacterized protein n=1 Tax=Symbiochloris irregularis TaxID=706552 RepID=A0AAW1P832_9CHLO
MNAIVVASARHGAIYARQQASFLPCKASGAVTHGVAKPLLAPSASRRSVVQVQARKDDLRDQVGKVGGVIKAGDTFAEGATDVLGGNLPRPLIKAGISLALFAFGWSLLKKAVSTAVFFGVAGTILTFVLKSQFSSKK